MTDSGRIEKIRAQIDELNKCPTYRDWELLNDVYSAYIINSNHLFAHVESPQSDPKLAIQLFDQDPEQVLKREFHRELLRHLVNYLATVSTLVDHSRNLMRRYKNSNPNLVEEYDVRMSKTITLPVVFFVQGLRNYLLHNRMPSVVVQMSFTSEQQDTQFTVRLDTEKLYEWGKWKNDARTYMNGKVSIAVRDAVIEYTDAIEALYDWLFSMAFPSVQRTSWQKIELQNELVRLMEEHDSTQ